MDACDLQQHFTFVDRPAVLYLLGCFMQRVRFKYERIGKGFVRRRVSARVWSQWRAPGSPHATRATHTLTTKSRLAALTQHSQPKDPLPQHTATLQTPDCVRTECETSCATHNARQTHITHTSRHLHYKHAHIDVSYHKKSLDRTLNKPAALSRGTTAFIPETRDSNMYM